MLFIFGIVTIYHNSLMHVRSKFTPCQNVVLFTSVPGNEVVQMAIERAKM